MSQLPGYKEVLDFWFKEATPEQWFKKDTDFDNTIIERFSALHSSVAAGEQWRWRESAQGRLAEIIVLDQFSRNLFRDKPEAFATDSLALVLAQEAVAGGYDQQLEKRERTFIYMPYMHSESSLIHEQAVELFTAHGEPANLDFEMRHKAIIDRFGRYPHRNDILGRVSTEEEKEFLTQPGSGF